MDRFDTSGAPLVSFPSLWVITKINGVWAAQMRSEGAGDGKDIGKGSAGNEPNVWADFTHMLAKHRPSLQCIGIITIGRLLNYVGLGKGGHNARVGTLTVIIQEAVFHRCLHSSFLRHMDETGANIERYYVFCRMYHAGVRP